MGASAVEAEADSGAGRRGGFCAHCPGFPTSAHTAQATFSFFPNEETCQDVHTGFQHINTLAQQRENRCKTQETQTSRTYTWKNIKSIPEIQQFPRAADSPGKYEADENVLFFNESLTQIRCV